MLNKYFQLESKQTNVRTEIVGGVTTFLTMAYIIFVNPNILSDQTGMDKEALIAVTCIVSAATTLITGLSANAPIAMAPGMGLNSFFAVLVASGKMSWQTALGAVFLSGVLFLLLTLFGLRKKLVEAIPASLVSAIAVGIGLFITFIGLKSLGIVVRNEITFVSAGPLTGTVLIGLFGLIVMIYFEIKKVTGALLIGIFSSTVLAVICKTVELPQHFVSFHLHAGAVAFKLDILTALTGGFFGTIFTLTFMDMFDSLGTLVACCHQANMVDEHGRIKGLDRLLAIDAIATVIGALFGTSTTSAYVESAAGIEQGGRTGLTAVVTGILFLLALLFVPIVGIVPPYATAPALIMVGLFMMKEVCKINFSKLDEAFPAFIIIVMIALSYSISTGLAFGFISFALIKVAGGKTPDVKPTMWVIAALSVLFLTLERLGELVVFLKNMV
jgi:AGZA family xanthine/uracil permease-like MFS transporter